MTESTCQLRIAREDDRSIRSVWIHFGGTAAHFPSTSNGKMIMRRRGGHAFIGNSPSTQARLQAANYLYLKALLDMGIALPSFDDEFVHVRVLLAKAAWRYDSHNYSKPIADWLQQVGMINDDSRAEVHCAKKIDYAKNAGANQKKQTETLQPLHETATTTIIVTKRAVLQRILEEALYEQLQVSSGDLRLIG